MLLLLLLKVNKYSLEQNKARKKKGSYSLKFGLLRASRFAQKLILFTLLFLLGKQNSISCLDSLGVVLLLLRNLDLFCTFYLNLN